jgi:nitroimidazol reductase NimA-like FMN-containing flavoprotein (pyridoxamine 5'-phosphate oxidase superfamily)
MEQHKAWLRFGNRALTITLRSPFYPLAGRTLLITIAGRRSGKAYTLPVNYARTGDAVTIISRRWRVWWKNLRGGAPVTLHLDGHDVKGWASVIEDDPGVVAALTNYVGRLRRVPRRYRDLEEAARTRVVVQVKLHAEANS